MGFFDKLINVIYPPKCIFCGELLGHDSRLSICRACYAVLPFMEEKLLTTTQDGEESNCNGAISVFKYAGMVKESLIRFKFFNKPGYFKTYAILMAQRIRRMADINQYDMVLSVPLQKDKEYSRGYNQAFLISRVLGKELNLPECSNLLVKLKCTEAQSLLDREKRRQNIKGAFKVTAAEKIEGKSILLIDDIMTTGSTLEECAKTLRQAGAVKVTAVVAATGRKV